MSTNSAGVLIPRFSSLWVRSLFKACWPYLGLSKIANPLSSTPIMPSYLTPLAGRMLPGLLLYSASVVILFPCMNRQVDEPMSCHQLFARWGDCLVYHYCLAWHLS